MAASANVTKYNAGGSGDNIIADGYIKTVEKVWIDSYTIPTDTMTASTATIDIAMIPSNKKITSIDIDIKTAVSQNAMLFGVGHAGNVSAFLPSVTVIHALTRSVIRLPGVFIQASSPSLSTIHFPAPDGFQMVTAGTTGTIQLILANWTATSGTIKTIVRYT